MPRHGPYLSNGWTYFNAYPIRDPISDGSTHRCGNPDWPEPEIACLDEHAQSYQRAPGRDKEREENERFAEGEHECDGRCPDFIYACELDNCLSVRFDDSEHRPAMR